ncbi:DedA family protein [Ancylobacter terrae]|uniref:DedA family protein n=1 Tax=Ancylobacter sp. sgz301288 TaxID=3342077 RepID=UPI00385E1051
MEQLTGHIMEFVSAHHAWAGPVLGLVAFGESLAFVGLVMPATALMLLVGGLIGTGALDPMPVIAWSVAGAVLGDAVSFWLGRRYGRGLFRLRALERQKTGIAKARLFFRRYGFASIFLGRFLGPVRSTIPLVAGCMLMGQRRFQFANVTSAIVWVPMMLAPGYLTGRSLGDLSTLDGGHLIAVVSGVAIVTTLLAVVITRVVGARGVRRRRPAVAAIEG